MTEEQLRALLRLKRFEQPPPGYFDQLLRDVHRRQRADLIQRPLWKIALERMQTFFGEHSMSPASYAGAMATLLILGVSVIGVISPSGGNPGHGASTTLASTKVSGGTTEPQRYLNLQTPMASDRAVSFSLENSRPSVQSGQSARHPRYVIDARPVSYEPSFRF